MVSEWGFSHRHIAAASLGTTKVRKAVVARGLLPSLKDQDHVLRLIVLQSLARIGDRDDMVIRSVRRLLKDSNGAVRTQAVVTLRKLTERVPGTENNAGVPTATGPKKCRTSDSA